MKYTIIIPTLNEEKLLPALLKQLNEKSLRNKFDYEIIVSDGGSSDRTAEIAINNSDIFIVNKKPEKQNIASGRNTGAKLASGEILIFINADVLIPEIDSFFSFIEKNFDQSKYLAMTCKVNIFPQEEIRSDKFFHTGYNNYFRIINSLGLGMGRGECQIIKKNIFESLNGYNENLFAGEDFDLFRRIRRIGKILFTPEIRVFESPRRFRKIGYARVTSSWIKNGFSVMVRNKSLSTEWEQVR